MSVLDWQRAFAAYEDVTVVGFHAVGVGAYLHLRRETTEIIARRGVGAGTREAARFVAVVVVEGVPLRRYESGALTTAHAVETFVRLLRQPYTPLRIAVRRSIANRMRAGKGCDHIPICNAAVEYVVMQAAIVGRALWHAEAIDDAANLIAPRYGVPAVRRSSP